MSRILKLVTISAVLSLGLSGCINVLPKTKPVTLYRFGYAPPEGQAAAPTAAIPVALSLGSIQFPADSGGDRVTTVEDNEISYVAQARWTAPAQALFNDAVSEGFARSGGQVRLDTKGVTLAPYRLDVAVRKFETVYTRNKPTVSVALDARIIRMSDKAVVGQKFITEEIATKRNNMEVMVDAYNSATTAAVSDLIAFSQATLAPLAEPATPMTQIPDNGKQKAEGL